MIKVYEDNVIDDRTLRPIEGVSIKVFNVDGTNAALFAVDGVTPIGNPVLTDSHGLYRFAAEEGYYRADLRLGGRLLFEKGDFPVGDLRQINKGNPGGNVMAVGPFDALGGLSIPLGTDRVRSKEGWDYTLDEAGELTTPIQLLASPTNFLSPAWTKGSAPVITQNGDYQTISDTNAASLSFVQQAITRKPSQTVHTAVLTVKKDAVPASTRQPMFQLRGSTGAAAVSARLYFNTSSGAVTVAAGAGLKAPDSFVVEDLGADWRITLVATLVYDLITASFYPAAGVAGAPITNATTGSVDVRLYDLFDGSTLLSSNPRAGFVSGNDRPFILAEEIVSPEMFGAKGDGKTNDTTAFQRLSGWINRLGSGHIRYSLGALYSVGRQIFAGATGKAYSWQQEPILAIANCQRPVIIDLNGATMRFADGLRFGSFDPVSGQPTSAISTNPDTRAGVGNLIDVTNSASTTIFGDGLLDGNAAGMVVGGYWGDTGYQLVANLLRLFGNDDVLVEDLRGRDCPTDGLVVGYNGITIATPLKPHVFRNLRISNCGRNAVSVVGSNAASFIDCLFRRSGEAYNAGVPSPNASTPAGIISTNPRSNFDIEAEGAINRNMKITNSRLIGGPYSATTLAADSGTSSDVDVLGCDLVGNVFISKPRFRFVLCTINGQFGTVYGMTPARLAAGARPSDAMLIGRCKVSDIPILGAAQATGSIIDCIGGGSGVRILDSDFYCAKTSFIINGAEWRGGSLTIARGTDTLADGQFAAQFGGAKIRDVAVRDEIPAATAPATGYYILGTFGNGGAGGTTNADMRDVTLTSPSGKLFWGSADPATGGHTGLAMSSSLALLKLQLAKNTGDRSGFYGAVDIVAGVGPPTIGTWAHGARMLNQAPVVLGVAGSRYVIDHWLCIAAGTPGTWLAIKILTGD